MCESLIFLRNPMKRFLLMLLSLLAMPMAATAQTQTPAQPGIDPHHWPIPLPWINPSPFYPQPSPYYPQPQPQPYYPTPTPYVNPQPAPQPTPAPSGYQWVVNPSGQWQLIPIPAHAVAPDNSGLLDNFGDFTEAIRAYRAKQLAGDQVATRLALPRIGRTPNPQRICTAIMLANVIGPIVDGMMQPPQKWTPIPMPAFCLAPSPSASVTLTPVPDAIGIRGPPQAISAAELNRVSLAVVNGMFDSHRFAPAKHLTGAKASPRAKLMAAPRYKATGPTPAQYSAIPPQLSMWGNSTYGDCVSAEEAFAKAAYSVSLSQSELFISEATVVSWASRHGFLNGANLTDVMDAMAAGGMTATSGTTTATYNDGPYSAINWTDSASLCNAISVGPVKIGVAASQLQNVVGSSNGWLGLNFSSDQSIDHCVALCGYGPLSYCCQQCGVSVPTGADPTQLCYLLFTWNTVGIVNQSSLNAICGEAWLRNPTTVVGPPAPTPSPTPTPAPRPTPTRRMADLLKDLPVLVAAYQDGTPEQKAQVLSLLDDAEKRVRGAKQKLGLAK
jgi:hypothetical protein